VNLEENIIKEIGKKSLQLFQASLCASIDIEEYSWSYDTLNKLVYNLDKEKYSRYRTPTVNKNFYELTCNIMYLIKLSGNNIIQVTIYKDNNNKICDWKHIKLTFFRKK